MLRTHLALFTLIVAHALSQHIVTPGLVSTNRILLCLKLL